MEKRINKELDDLTNEGYETHIHKDKNNKTILTTDTFKLELPINYPFTAPYIYIALNNGKYATIYQMECLLLNKKIFDTFKKEDMDKLQFINSEIKYILGIHYSPSIPLTSYVKHLDFLSKTFYNYDKEIRLTY